MLVLRSMSWLLLAGVLALLLSMPISLKAQLTLALAALAVLAALYAVGPRTIARQLFIGVASVIIVKYLHWRITSTLPPFDSLVDFTAAVALLAAEIYSILALYLTMFVVIEPLEREPVAPARDAPLPTVDVFVPTYDESVDLVAHTLAAAKAMDYDPERVTVWLLDDGGTDEKTRQADPAAREEACERKADLMEVCNRLGVRYLARPRNEMAKAGNLNFGLARASADLVAVLDADHAPRPDFLKKTVGHFQQDDGLFLVQTPHAFLNDDPVERNMSLARQMPAEHQMFYKALQKGLDSWNASYFCGSAAVLRRAALDEVGGFAGLSVTEDCETALELHARGWTSRFVDEALIWGLQPETFTSLIKQRSRWCSGMIQIFLLKNPVVRGRLTMAQRFAYTASCLYWFFPLMRLTFVIAPLLYIFLSMEIFMASVDEFVAYTAPYLAAVVLLQSFLFGRHRWAWMSEVYEYVQAVHLWRSVIGTVVAPRRPQFNVTPKGFVLGEETLSALAPPYFAVFALLAVAAVISAGRIAAGETESLLYIVTGWNLFNLVIAGAALGAVCDRRELRLSPRLDVERAASLFVDGIRAECVVENISRKGLLARITDGRVPLAPGTRAVLCVPGRRGRRSLETEVVIRRRAGTADRPAFGASFERVDEQRFAAVAELLCASPATGLDRMAERSGYRVRNFLVWTAEFLLLAVRETARGIGFAVGGRRESAARPVRPAADPVRRLRAAMAAQPRSAVAVLVLASAALVAAGSAMANTGPAASGARPAPGDGASAGGLSILVRPARQAGEGNAPPVRDAADDAPTVLRRLPVGEGTLFLQGEWTRRSISLHLSAGDIARVRAIAVTARTSVTALPEATSVDVWLNGTLLGRVETPHGAPARTLLPVPQDLLSPGFNEIRITARHQHRASCRLDAGYELWTRLDPAATGLVMAPGGTDPRSLPALLGRAADPTRLALYVPEDAGARAATHVLRLAQAVVLAGHMIEPRAGVVRDRAAARGVVLSVGPARGGDWRPVAGLPGLVARTADGRTRELRLLADGPGAAAARLDALSAALPRVPGGAEAGVAAFRRAAPQPLTPGQTVTLEALGASDRFFAGRRFRETVFVDLPADIVTTGEETVTLKLKGDYARTLTDDARLVIKVNGARVRSMPLSATPETTLDHKPFVIPLDPFHAGRNRLTIEAELPAEADTPCAAGSAAVDRARFFLSGRSTLTLPELGRAGVTPDLAALWWAGFPYKLAQGPTDLFVGDNGRGLDAGAALVAAITANARAIEPVTVRFETPAKRTPGILVGERAALPDFALAMIDGRDLAARSGGFAAALAARAEAAQRPDGHTGAARVRLAQRSWPEPGRRPVVSALVDRAVPSTLTVAAVSAAAMHDVVARGPDVIPFQPRGHRFAYRGGSDEAAFAPARTLIFATQPPGLRNLQLVVGKWLSNHPSVYVSLLLATAGLLGLSLAASAAARRRARRREGLFSSRSNALR